MALGLTAAVTGAQADVIVELTSSRVIELRATSPREKAPVVSGVALDPSNQLLATAGDDHAVRIWDARQGQIIRRLAAHTDWVQAAVFSPDGKVLATAARDRRIKLWQMSTGQTLKTFSPSAHGISVLAFSPDGGLLAAAGFESKVWVYEVNSGRLLRAWEAPGPDTRALAFSPDGKQLAAAGRTGRIRIWRTPTATLSVRNVSRTSGERVGDLTGHRRRVRALAYSPDGKRLASAGDGQSIRLWDASTLAALAALPPRPGKVFSLAFCGPDRLAAGSSNNLIRIWDLTTGAEQFRLVGHTGSVAALVWDPEASVLISGSFDTTVRLWPLRNDINVISRR